MTKNFSYSVSLALFLVLAIFACNNEGTTVRKIQTSLSMTGAEPISAIKDYSEQEPKVFEPGVDDWPMGNNASYNAESGMCGGMTTTMLWYFVEKRLKNKMAPPLNKLLDNDGGHSTPDFWQDESKALIFCIRVHNMEEDLAFDATGMRKKQMDLSDEQTMKQLTNVFNSNAPPKPQYLHLSNEHSDAHAVLVYKISGDVLYVADPNYPGWKKEGKDRKIEYNRAQKKFKPYTSGETVYDSIAFFGEDLLVPFSEIEKLWQKIGTIGEPDYEFKLSVYDKNNKLVPFIQGFKVGSNQMLKIHVESEAVGKLNQDSLAYRLYDGNNRLIDTGKPLPPGQQTIGIEVTYSKKWFGFRRMDIDVPGKK